MDNRTKELFREKNMKKAAEPERFDGYLRVTGIGPWFVLLAAALILAAIFAWALFGRAQTVIAGAGICENGTLICYVAQEKIDEITVDTMVEVGGTPVRVTNIDPSLYDYSQIPNEVLYLLPDSWWYCKVTLDCPLADGLYTVSFYQEAVAPVSFMTQGD